MSSFTNFLNLFKWNPQTDAEEEFDIDKALNDNWDKIDAKLEDYIDEVDQKIEDFEKNSFATVEMTNRYISDAYDNTKTYVVGDYCIYNNILYKCKTAVTTAEEFNNTKWEQTNITEEIKTEDFKSNIIFGEAAVAGNSRFVRVGKMVFIEYQGESKTHASGDVIFTVPSGYEPAAGNVPTIFVKNANAFGTVQLNKATRQCTIAAISDSNVTGRLYFSMFYNVA